MDEQPTSGDTSESECEVHQGLTLLASEWVKPYRMPVLNERLQDYSCNLASCNNPEKCGIPPCKAIKDEDENIDSDCSRGNSHYKKKGCRLSEIILRVKGPTIGSRRHDEECSPYVYTGCHQR